MKRTADQARGTTGDPLVGKSCSAAQISHGVTGKSLDEWRMTARMDAPSVLLTANLSTMFGNDRNLPGLEWPSGVTGRRPLGRHLCTGIGLRQQQKCQGMIFLFQSSLGKRVVKKND